MEFVLTELLLIVVSKILNNQSFRIVPPVCRRLSLKKILNLLFSTFLVFCFSFYHPFYFFVSIFSFFQLLEILHLIKDLAKFQSLKLKIIFSWHLHHYQIYVNKLVRKVKDIETKPTRIFIFVLLYNGSIGPLSFKNSILQS